MIEAYAVPGVYACEAAAAAQLAEGELMARAVEGLVAVARARLAATGGRQVVALVGPGNNGADALYAAATGCHAGPCTLRRCTRGRMPRRAPPGSCWWSPAGRRRR